jgi:hypothetical protein
VQVRGRGRTLIKSLFRYCSDLKVKFNFINEIKVKFLTNDTLLVHEKLGLKLMWSVIKLLQR